ncbi:anti-sigma factor antagonist [Gemmobacter lutimaris]|uniref:Anti-sigma factor antagonist n=1 Tax=Gemmobacter lutimaris TaxID=2306023 RepID=A0A398BX61_9RHOB|nr:STAS domain-containing protein [Gemmobacter lutimaris]RID92540.1 anti-sigma factor antagonist [Gemmobacter lutimaris]
MNLHAKTLADTLLVEVEEDRIDAACAIQFKDRMRELVAKAEGRVLIDMARVRFLDSSGLGAVVAVMKLLGPERRLELAGLTPAVDKVFRLTRMDSVFRIHPDLPAALREAG